MRQRSRPAVPHERYNFDHDETGTKEDAAFYEELKHSDVSENQDAKSRAFTLRCKACNEEGVYAMEAIREFEGMPRARAEKDKVARA